MDPGVIQALKLRYRIAQFRYMLAEMETDKTNRRTQIMKRMHLFSNAMSFKSVLYVSFQRENHQ